jgi:hypothetical protein
MSDMPTPPPPRRRRVRSAAARVHVPAREGGGRSHGLPSPRRVLAQQVVAWHNKHPLARRIGRRQLGGYGVISLPFSPAPSEASSGSGWAESTSTRFPMFDDLPFLPGLSVQKVVALALAEGWVERPGAPEWPLRKVPVGKGWESKQAERIHLLTAAIKRGRGRPPLRVLIGRHGPVGDHLGVVGHRVLSRPRMALAALVAALPMLGMAWGVVGLLQGLRGPTTPAPIVAEAPPAGAPGAVAAAPGPAPAVRALPPPMAGPAVAVPRGPDTFLPPPSGSDGGQSATSARGSPKIGSGVGPEGPGTRAAAPVAFRLMAAPQRDPAALQKQALRLQAILDTLGNTGSRLRMDVVGTPDGDALAIGPLLDQVEAERVAKRLQARGFVLMVVEQ